MNVIPLQSLSDADFGRLVQAHAAQLGHLMAVLAEHQEVNRYLQAEAQRRAAANAAIPNTVREAVQGIMDNVAHGR